MKFKEQLIDVVKSSRIIYAFYYYSASLFIKILKLFVKPDDKLVLFVSFGGRFYNESPRTLYEAMKEDPRFEGYKLVWAFRSPDEFKEVPNKVKIDGLSFFKTAMKARCWITNVAVERGLSFKPQRTFYFHTTHTTLPKVMGIDNLDSGGFVAYNIPKIDCICACSEYEAEKEKHMYNITSEKILLSGYPKNDNLTKVTKEEIEYLRKKIGIPAGKRIILYAPTYRENSGITQGLKIDLDKWYEILGKEYYILFRAHPTMTSGLNLDNDDFVKDVSRYPDNTELMKVADMLISDYSGIFFEFAPLERPMFCYAYDYESYISKRKLYFDIRQELPGGLLDEDGLLNLIKENPSEVTTQVRKFREKFVTCYGHATEICLNRIYDEIK